MVSIKIWEVLASLFVFLAREIYYNSLTLCWFAKPQMLAKFHSMDVEFILLVRQCDIFVITRIFPKIFPIYLIFRQINLISLVNKKPFSKFLWNLNVQIHLAVESSYWTFYDAFMHCQLMCGIETISPTT